jgi:alcohol dehydrogenase, propanol-preferring
MRAWHFTGTRKPFERVEIDEPAAGPGKVVIDVKAAGLCHSDVGILEDEKWLQQMVVPVVPGHETAGVISEVGEGVTGFKVGDRVTVWPMAELMGYMVNGGWEDKSEVSAEALIRIPEGVSFAQAAAAADAGMTAHSAVMDTGEVTAGMKVGIIGFGGLGQIGARVAHLNGAQVFVAEVNESIWNRAKEAGAVKVAKNVKEFKEDDLDVIVDFAGFGTTTADAIETVGFNGRVVQVGMGRLESTISTYAVIMGKVQLHGSAGGSKNDIEEVMKWIAKGELNPLITEIDFEEIPAGIEQVTAGTAQGRLVAKVAD